MWVPILSLRICNRSESSKADLGAEDEFRNLTFIFTGNQKEGESSVGAQLELRLLTRFLFSYPGLEAMSSSTVTKLFEHLQELR